MSTEQENQIVVKVQLDLLPSGSYKQELIFVAETYIDPENGQKYVNSMRCLQWAEKYDGICSIPRYISGNPKDFVKWVASHYLSATKVQLISSKNLD